MNYLNEANAILDEIIEYRRTLHKNPEIGFDLPKTVAFVVEKLKSFGYNPEVVEDSGVVVTVGQEGKVVLLRADMDALPIKEESGEPFSSENDYMHACGHDYHTAVLLGAAKLLKKNETNLKGTVKLLFQPAEELLVGGEVMVEAGVLENPKVDVACGFHVMPTMKAGVYTGKGAMMASANNFKISITGKGSHGAMPFQGVDPVNIGSHIIISAQEILARELSVFTPIVLTMGRFMADGAINVVPNGAEIAGTIRTFNTQAQEHAKKRLVEIAESTAKTFRGEAKVEFLCDVPVLETDSDVTDSFNQYVGNMSEGHFEMYEAQPASGSEDFAHITNKVPSAHFLLGTSYPGAETLYNVHHPKVRFDEQQIPVGVAAFCEFATKWLEDHSA